MSGGRKNLTAIVVGLAVCVGALRDAGAAGALEGAGRLPGPGDLGLLGNSRLIVDVVADTPHDRRLEGIMVSVTQAVEGQAHLLTRKRGRTDRLGVATFDNMLPGGYVVVAFPPENSNAIRAADGYYYQSADVDVRLETFLRVTLRMWPWLQGMRVSVV